MFLLAEAERRGVVAVVPEQTLGPCIPCFRADNSPCAEGAIVNYCDRRRIDPYPPIEAPQLRPFSQ